MDKDITPADRIRTGLVEEDRSRAWLARNTQIPLTTLDRKLRGNGADFTLAQIHAIAAALRIPLDDLVAPISTEATA